MWLFLQELNMSTISPFFWYIFLCVYFVFIDFTMFTKLISIENILLENKCVLLATPNGNNSYTTWNYNFLALKHKYLGHTSLITTVLLFFGFFRNDNLLHEYCNQLYRLLKVVPLANFNICRSMQLYLECRQKSIQFWLKKYYTYNTRK